MEGEAEMGRGGRAAKHHGALAPPPHQGLPQAPGRPRLPSRLLPTQPAPLPHALTLGGTCLRRHG
eukprot:1364172-Rhodomonas_salina.3